MCSTKNIYFPEWETPGGGGAPVPGERRSSPGGSDGPSAGTSQAAVADSDQGASGATRWNEAKSALKEKASKVKVGRKSCLEIRVDRPNVLEYWAIYTTTNLVCASLHSEDHGALLGLHEGIAWTDCVLCTKKVNNLFRCCLLVRNYFFLYVLCRRRTTKLIFSEVQVLLSSQKKNCVADPFSALNKSVIHPPGIPHTAVCFSVT